MSTTRRSFLKGGLGSALGLSLAAAAALPAQPRTARPRLLTQPVAAGVDLLTGAGTNVVLVTTGDGVVVIDSGTLARAGDLFDAVRGRARGARPLALFNTHWHWDHTGANERFGKAGVPIIAHENTKLWLGMAFTVRWENRDYQPRPRQALPTETFFRGTRSRDFGGLRFDHGWLPRAHTDGDLYVHLPDRNVLVVGDLLAVGSYPLLDVDTGGWLGREGETAPAFIGWTGGMIDANRRLIELCDEKTVVVPGSGPLQTRADLVAQRAMLVTVRDRLADLLRKGQGIDEILAARPTAEFDAERGDPTLFLTNAWRGLVGHGVTRVI